MIDEDEVWLPVADHDGYEVSDAGRVRSWRAPRVGCRRSRAKILRPAPPDKGGYLTVSLSSPRKTTRRIHHLVLEAFVGPRPLGTEACHNNGDPCDNRLINLRWDTSLANKIDQLRHAEERAALQR